jgi:hypothetical protein
LCFIRDKHALGDEAQHVEAASARSSENTSDKLSSSSSSSSKTQNSYSHLEEEENDDDDDEEYGGGEEENNAGYIPPQPTRTVSAPHKFALHVSDDKGPSDYSYSFSDDGLGSDNFSDIVFINDKRNKKMMTKKKKEKMNNNNNKKTDINKKSGSTVFEKKTTLPNEGSGEGLAVYYSNLTAEQQIRKMIEDRAQERRNALIPRLVFAGSLVTQLGAGMTVKYYPLFFMEDVGMTPAAVQV